MSQLLLIVLGTGLLSRPGVAEYQKPSTEKTTKDSNSRQHVLAPASTTINPSSAPRQSETKLASSQQESPEKPLPRFERPEWVIVYVTAIYVLINWWMLRAIKRQSDIMEQQAQDARGSSATASAIAAGTLRAVEEQAKAAGKQADASRIIAENASTQAHATNALAAAAQESAKIARQQLEASSRPWIVVSISLGGPLIFTASGTAQLSFDVEVRNVGYSPALNLRVHSDLVVYTYHLKVVDRQKQSSRSIASNLIKFWVVPFSHKKTKNCDIPDRRLGKIPVSTRFLRPSSASS